MSLIEKRTFGRTGHMSSAVLFGAAALKNVDQATADRTLELLDRHGVNHIDTAPRYGDAELRIGPWMESRRGDFFLATKTDCWEAAACREQIHRSLERLRTDHVDLIQLHALIHPDDWEQALGPGGALDACLQARDEGLVRFIGVTGHGWNVAAMHRRSLERFDFDSVLMPWNWFAAQRTAYAADFERTVALCQECNAAVQTIKSIARGPWAAGKAPDHNTWYQPLDDPADIAVAVGWVLQRSELFLNSAGDLGLLPHVLEAAARLQDGEAAEAGPAAIAAMSERAGLASIFGI